MDPQEREPPKSAKELEFEARLTKEFVSEFITTVFERYYTAW